MHNYHGLIDLYEAEYTPRTTKQQMEHELVWMSLKEVATMDFDRAGSAPHIVQRITDNTILPRMTWFADDIAQNR